MEAVAKVRGLPQFKANLMAVNCHHNYVTKETYLGEELLITRKDKDVIDEIPMAYKDIDAVMRAQADLVEVVHTLKQVVCVKG